MKYKGQELTEITEPQIFDPPREMVVWDDGNEPTIKYVWGIAPPSANRRYIVATIGNPYQHCAEIPEEPKPRRATNRELARWLAEGNGEYCFGTSSEKRFGSSYGYGCIEQDSEVSNLISVRKWDDTDWHEPDVEYMELEG